MKIFLFSVFPLLSYFEGSQTSVSLSLPSYKISVKVKMIMKDWWNNADGGKPCFSENIYPTDIHSFTKLTLICRDITRVPAMRNWVNDVGKNCSSF